MYGRFYYIEALIEFEPFNSGSFCRTSNQAPVHIKRDSPSQLRKERKERSQKTENPGVNHKTKGC